MNNKLLIVLLITISAFVLNSCATILLGTMHNVKLDTNPQGAKVSVNGIPTGHLTPCEIEINKRIKPKVYDQFNKKNTCVYTFEREGYQDYIYNDKSKFHWLAGVDFYFYVVPGLVDVGTGANRRYKKEVYANLTAIQKKEIADNIPPEIIITSPNVTRGFKSVTDKKEIAIAGIVKDKSGVHEVLMNGKQIITQSNGVFSCNAILVSDYNLFTVTATDMNNNTVSLQFVIEKKIKQQQTFIVQYTGLQHVTYYARIIGAQEY